MLEKMDAFFDARLSGYDTHMLEDILGAKEFYPFTAAQLPMEESATVLDLGCGTGLELGYYFPLNPKVTITAVDMAKGMLSQLERKFSAFKITTCLGSYFDLPLGEACFDAAVSVESLHHFTMEEKLPLYAKLHRALREGGYFILTDYFARSDEEEAFFQGELLRLKKEQGITDDTFYHYDTPLTVSHEIQVLLQGGFSKVTVLNQWGATYTLKAEV